MLLRNALPRAVALMALSSEAAKPRDAILLSQVESLTLRGDRRTSHRRVPSVPQLKCISAPALCAKHQIDLMRCENKGAGYDSEDIQWSCTASLPPELKLGSTDVICEGYSGPDDPYILKGSCGVEYRLGLTREGEEKWPDVGSGTDSDSPWPGRTNWPATIFWVIFFVVAGWIVYSAWNESQRNRRERRAVPGGGPRRGGGGGGGGGGWDGDDPPPPYPGTNNYKRGGTGARRNQQNGWRTDWLSGAAGAAAGYYMGSRGRNQSNQNQGGYDGGGFGNSRNYGSTWGSGGAGPSRSGSSGSSSGSAASSSRYESTGFGSTSRR